MPESRKSRSKVRWRDLSFGKDTYRSGAMERMEEARLLKDRGRFAFSMYAGGVAVEGMLRSLCCIESVAFDPRHELRKLAIRVKDLGLLRRERDDDFVGAVNGVAKRWRNTLRYADQDHLERFLKKTKAIRSKKDTPKTVCNEHFDQCSQVLKRCEVLWTRSRKES